METIYRDLTENYTRDIRVEDLVFEAAERHPELNLPGRAEIDEERSHRQSEKRGAELRQGAFLKAVLADQGAGTHLCHAMLRPRSDSLPLRKQFQRTGSVDLGLARVTRRADGIGEVELKNTRFLNAEDDAATAALERGVDLVLLDPQCEVGVIRGAPVDHPRYQGRRVFNAGINLTHLYHGQISLVDFFVSREMGLINKIYRGLWNDAAKDTDEKPWIAAVESFAIGGGCQVLLVTDRVIAERGAYFNLPARKEGIIPGCANLRLPRLVGERLARQAIMFERAFKVDEPDGALLCDEVHPSGNLDDAIAANARQLMSAGAQSAASNRKAIRLGQEPLDLFRLYMSMYSLEQAKCVYSPALIHNLEKNWDAARRKL